MRRNIGRTRGGNTIVMALGVFALAAVLIGTAVEGAADGSRRSRDASGHQQALAALDAVLARRELMIVERAGQGDPVEIARWAGNYGVDFVGEVEVRWKIEPVRTPPKDAAGNPVYHIANPSPDPNWTVPTSSPTDPANANEPFWQSNDTNYLFRIAGEARFGVDARAGTATSASGQQVVRPLNVVQGARYASVLQEPLFRYVIFYAARGLKGDLELSHADNVEIQGSVHTNGALYVGGGLKVNDEVARLGAIDGTFANSFTKIGPDADGNPVRVNGVDGIFRLSKPLMYTIINGFPRTNSATPSTGSPASTAQASLSWTAADSYLLAATPAQPTDPPGAAYGSVLAATLNGRHINPYRIQPGSAAVTENTANSADGLRTINGTAIRGVDANSDPDKEANDGRDASRPDGKKWTQVSILSSAPGFNGKARSKLTGQNVKSLPERMRNRGFEAQRLEYQDFDGDEATDEHEFARPRFVRADGSTTTDFPKPGLGFPEPGGTVLAVEDPGQYLRFALGSDAAYMVRRPDGLGWVVRTRDNQPVADPAAPGLIIRERPIPRSDYWPGAESRSVVARGDPRWMPFAYGKHWYPSTFRFTIADIAEEVAPTDSGTRPWFNGWTSDLNPYSTNRIATTANARVVSYAPGGSLRITAAQRAAGTSTTINNAYLGADDQYRRKPYFYAQNWRFVHLGQTRPASSGTGLRYHVFNDRPTVPGGTTQTRNSYSLLSDGDPLATGVVSWSTGGNLISTMNGLIADAAARVNQTSASTGHRSVRFDGFITPTSSNLYAFITNLPTNTGTADPQGVRIWINGELKYSNWGANQCVEQVANPFGSPYVRMTAGVPARIQIDYFYRATNQTPALNLYWRTNEPTVAGWAAIPISVFTPSAENPGFAKDSFTAVQMRIDNPMTLAGPAQQKVGLMIRDGSGAMSGILSGSAPYAFVGFSPARGFFSERQKFRHTQESKAFASYYIGNGSGTVGGAANSAGEVIDAPATQTRSGLLQQTALSAVTTGAASNATSTNISYGSTSYTSAAGTPPTTSRDMGGGVIWTIITPFTYGTRTGTRTYTPRTQVTRTQTKTQTQTIALVGGSYLGPFNGTTDHNQNLNIYTSTTGTGTLGGSASGQARWSATHDGLTDAAPPADGRWYFFGGTAQAQAYTQLRRSYSSTSQATATANGTTETQSVTFGTPTTIWSSSTIQINKNGVITNASVSDINTVTGMTFAATMNPSTSMPTPTGVTYPPAPAAPTITTPADPTIPALSTARTFSLQRTGSTVTLDSNGWVSRTGTIFDPATTRVFLPTLGSVWPSSWSSSTPTTWPQTSSFRPDVYALAAAPAYTTTTTNPPSNPATAPNSVFSTVAPWRLSDDIAPPPATTTEVWLRIEKSGSVLTLKYYAGTTPPASPAAFTTMAGTLDISNWGSSLLVGPAVQSGDTATVTTANLSNLRIETSLPAPNDVIDATDWDTSTSGQDVIGRYLASQYQVWWGTREITEDFFTWSDPATGRRIASEDWIWNPREFWSQSRWWDHLAPGNVRVLKDDATAPNTNFNNTAMREALAKTTLLTIDAASLQSYLQTRMLSEAAADRIAGPNHDTALGVPAGGADYVLRSRFSGLVYAVRTNRFPWNPNANPFLKNERLAIRDGTGAITGYNGDTDGINPYSPSSTMPLPNSLADMDDDTPERANAATLRGWALDPGYGDDLLQPYPATDLPNDPPLKPQQFSHGVRIVNGASLHWGFDGTRSTSSTRAIGTSGTIGTDWSWAPTPAFGTSRTSIVTPNALYIQGNFNTDRHITTKGSETIPRFTPVAVMGDSITMLSNAFRDSDYQIPGLSVADIGGIGSVTGSGTLACATLGAFASDTEYNTAIATHNIPSTRDRVAEGQSAPFIDTTQFLENWNGREMKYLGSLVVMDTRRYTRAFLHDALKTYGQTPFGIVDNAGTWLGVFNDASLFAYTRPLHDGTTEVFKTRLYGVAATVDWAGRSPIVYSEPRRVYEFNYDLLTEEGTPPFSPFGVSTSGVGGWARIIK